MNKYDRKAAAEKVITRDSEAAEGKTYNEKETRRAVVHTREDIVLLASHLSSINRQLRWVRVLLVLIFVAIVVIMIP